MDELAEAIVSAFAAPLPDAQTGPSPFWDEAVEELVKEPDPDRRERILAQYEPRTRANVEATYAAWVRRSLETLEKH